MTNTNWVCFECHRVVRRPKQRSDVPECPGCSAATVSIGYKVGIPGRSDLDGWRKLREDLLKRRLRDVDAAAVAKVRKRHAIERRITELRARPENAARSRLIAELQKQLSKHV